MMAKVKVAIKNRRIHTTTTALNSNSPITKAAVISLTMETSLTNTCRNHRRWRGNKRRTDLRKNTDSK